MWGGGAGEGPRSPSRGQICPIQAKIGKQTPRPMPTRRVQEIQRATGIP